MATDLSIIYTNKLWGDALRALLCSNKDFCVGHFLHTDQCKAGALRSKSIVILETVYPSAEVLRQVKELKTSGHYVLLVGYHLNNEFLQLLFEYDLDAFVLKTCGKSNLFEAIHNVDQGQKYFCAPITESLSKRLHDHQHGEILTTREKEILLGLVSLVSTAQIAKKMNISEATVRTHRKNIMHKFGAKNYLGLLRYACRNGLLHTPNEPFCVGCRNKKCVPAQNG
ncbi:MULTISPECIES: response regulator transcription factor [unclassified Carboxylicivirga]|uniref:response regulator transcription factor n=1 Tax=Carboxylicivirga TaxID=1628153 RepID=UPI003D329791